MTRWSSGPAYESSRPRIRPSLASIEHQAENTISYSARGNGSRNQACQLRYTPLLLLRTCSVMSGKKSAFDVLGKRKPAAKDADDGDYVPAAEEAPAKKKPRRTITGPKVGHCGMDKKALGDAIKDGLAIEKYGAQRTMVRTTMDVVFFKAFFDTGIAGVKIEPSTYDDTTPVVTAQFGYNAAGELFGVSKVKGGNRYTENHIEAVMAVLYPTEKKFVMFFSI